MFGENASGVKLDAHDIKACAPILLFLTARSFSLRRWEDRIVNRKLVISDSAAGMELEVHDGTFNVLVVSRLLLPVRQLNIYERKGKKPTASSPATPRTISPSPSRAGIPLASTRHEDARAHPQFEPPMPVSAALTSRQREDASSRPPSLSPPRTSSGGLPSGIRAASLSRELSLGRESAPMRTNLTTVAARKGQAEGEEVGMLKEVR